MKLVPKVHKLNLLSKLGLLVYSNKRKVEFELKEERRSFSEEIQAFFTSRRLQNAIRGVLG